MSEDRSARCSSCRAAPGVDAARWAVGRTPLTRELALCPSCHATLSPRAALQWQRRSGSPAA